MIYRHHGKCRVLNFTHSLFVECQQGVTVTNQV